MRRPILLMLLSFYSGFLIGQTKAELEEQRQKTLEEITYVDNLLKETSKEKTESLNDLNIIGKKLNLRESVIKDLHDELSLLERRIELNRTAIILMENDLLVLRRDYRNAVLNSYRTSKGNQKIGYILSSSDFNQGYKRMKYLQQITKLRRQESEVILEIKTQVESTKLKLEEDLGKVSDLKSREEQQKNLLKAEQDKKQRTVKSLSKKERQLKSELDEKRRIARKIEAEISRLIEEESKKSVKQEMTPESKVLSNNFLENKGKLPWPVEQGVITSQFGIRNHPVLKYVTEDNIDIEITSYGNTTVRSVFKGDVVKVFSIPGANMAVIVRHGKYLSVYQNLVNVKVKAGDKVETKQAIGSVFRDTDNGDKAILKFMIFEEKVKLDPELWISKKK